MEQFQHSGLTFPVVDRGPAGGEVVVLLHGFPQSASSYDAVATRLVEQGYRTLVPTQRGYAATARPPARRDYRLGELVDDVIGLIDTAHAERVHLVGHDWGGGVAWALAGWHPERLHSLTVLSTPHPTALNAAMLHSSQALKSWYMALFQLPALPEFALSRSLAGTLARSGLRPEQVAEYSAAMAEDGALTAALNWYRAVPLKPRAEIPAISVPTTYVWGEKDAALGRYAAEHTGDHVIGDYRFEPIRAGHWLPETRPDVVAAAILARARGNG